MKKSILYILLIFTILFISCNCESSKKLKDFVIYDGVLYCYLGEDTTVEIPSYYYQDGKKTKITKISEKAFSDTCVKNVILGRYIEIIDDYAFYDSDITSIKLNKNVKSIGEKAFYNIGIKFLNGDNNDLSKCINLENIGNYAFGNGIEGLILPEGIDCISLLSDSRTNVPSYCNVYKNGFYIGTKDNPYEYLVGYMNKNDFYLHEETKKIYNECPNKIIIEENANYKKVNGSIYEVSNNKLVYAEFEDNTELVLDETVTKEYQLEYGSNTLCMHADAVKKGDKVLIIDDLLATGGTIGATVDLIKSQGAEVVGCAFVVELTELKGREKFEGIEVLSLTEYPY